MPILFQQDLKIFVSEILETVGSSREAAAHVAGHLVESNLAGHDSHGVIRVVEYCRHAQDGMVRPTETPTIEREKPCTAVVNGHQGWGAVTAQFAINLAIEKAKKFGLSAVLVKGSHHVGRIGVYVTRAAEEGLIGTAYCNVQGPARVAPWGSGQRRLCTNPIAFAFPTGQDPIVVDFASSTVAEGKVRLARTSSKPVPLGWVVGPDGQFTSDPNVAYEEGAIAPLGSDQGHKGYCLALAMDLFTGVLSGEGCAQMVKRYANGLLFQVLDPACFTESEELYRNLNDYVRYVKGARPKPGSEVLLPGEIERRRREQRLREGISVDQAVWSELLQLAQSLGVQWNGSS